MIWKSALSSLGFVRPKSKKSRERLEYEGFRRSIGTVGTVRQMVIRCPNCFFLSRFEDRFHPARDPDEHDRVDLVIRSIRFRSVRDGHRGPTFVPGFDSSFFKTGVDP